MLKRKIIPTMKWILDDNHPILRTKAEECNLPLSQIEQEFLDKMMAYIDASYNDEYDKYNIRPGVAIAANQVGWLKRVIYLHFDDENGDEVRLCLANPEIINDDKTITYLENGEGCLSVPKDHEGIVPRKNSIVVSAYDLLNNKEIIINATGLKAVVLQHEIDHLNGILYYDHINLLNPQYANKDWKKL